jgi:hypothetical protein
MLSWSAVRTRRRVDAVRVEAPWLGAANDSECALVRGQRGVRDRPLGIVELLTECG